MNPTNSYDAQGYTACKAISLCLDNGDMRDSYIHGYEPDHRSTVPAQADPDALYRGRTPQETSYIRPVSLGCLVRAGFPNASVIAIGSANSSGILVELLVDQHDHVFGLASSSLEREDDAVVLLDRTAGVVQEASA